jgi:acyl transferase domain-containing protein
VAIAAINGPENTVISGEREAVRAVLQQLTDLGIGAKQLTVSHAFHSPLMEPMLKSFEQTAAQVKYSSPQIGIISNLTGRLVEAEMIATPQYWHRHVREAVRFSSGMETLHEQGYELFVEVGPKPVLLGMGKNCLPEGVGVWLPTLRRGKDDWQQILQSLGALYVRGVNVDWAGFEQNYTHRRVTLPTYPFQRQRFWFQIQKETPKKTTQQTETLPESIPTIQPQTKTLRACVWEIFAQHLKIPEHQVEGHKTFQEMGLDSLGVLEVVKQLGTALKQELSPTLLFKYQTLDDLADYLERQYGYSGTVTPVTASKIVAADPRLDVGDKDIAIIGMACKFPGANNLEEFWDLLIQGRSAITDVPEERWHSDDYFQADGTATHTTYCKRGGFIDRPFDFDPMFFGISPREAIAMDPQQRVFLEVAWQTLQQAGYGSRNRTAEIGVFVGANQNNYAEHFFNYQRYAVLHRRLQESDWFSTLSNEAKQHLSNTLLEVMEPGEISSDALAGIDLNMIASRVSHCLDLKGPSLAVNTACSSALVALHIACESLRSGQTQMAIVGGVTLNLSPTPFVLMSQMQAISPTANCAPFDRRANGTMLGEGAGALLLKPLQKALEDGDFIHAVIKGSAINNDGRSQSISAPNPLGLAEVIRTAYRNSGIDPQTISFLEAHGTGTLLGDPVEVESSTTAFRTFTEKRRFCALGSVKSSIGHLLAAAGIPSIIKVVLAMQHGRIPPTFGYQEPNPHINFNDTPFYVVGGKDIPWVSKDSPLRAGINGFGISRTNAHVILEQAPTLPSAQLKENFASPAILFLAGRSQQSLQEVARQLHTYLEQKPHLEPARVCFTLSNAQHELMHKAAILVNDRQHLLDTLNAISRGNEGQGIYLGRSNPNRATPVHLVMDGNPFDKDEVAILAQRFPIFESAYTDCQNHYSQALADRDENSPTNLTEQAHTFAVQYALGRLLMSLDLQPTSLLVEGTGILSGACLVGSLTLKQGMAILAQIERGQGSHLVDGSALGQSALLWNCPLVTPAGIIQGTSSDHIKELIAPVQTLQRLQAEHCRNAVSTGGVYLHLGCSSSIKEQLGILNDPQTWIDLSINQQAIYSLLTIFGRLYVAGVRLNTAPLFPKGICKVPLPTYPFEQTTYRVSYMDSNESHKVSTFNQGSLRPYKPSPLSESQCQLSHMVLVKEFAGSCWFSQQIS